MLRRSRTTDRVDATSTQVTRRHRRDSNVRRGVFGRAGRRPRVVALGAATVVLAGAGVTYASAVGFGGNQVGTEYADGIQVSGNQIIKPIGDRLVTEVGKFMGSTTSPDGRFLAASSTDRSVALQIFDLSSYRPWTIWSRAWSAPV